MPRHRVAVALLAPPALAAQVDTLRRAVGVAEPFHVAPHLTLVSPVNVAADVLGEVRSLLRTAAASTAPFTVRIGPADSFSPDSPTLHLAVGGDPGALDALAGLRDRVHRPPLDRPDEWPFTPHVTLAEAYPADRIPAAVEVLVGVEARWTVTAVHFMEQRRRDDGSVHWVPVAEEPLGGPRVVGRGGLELALRTVAMVRDEVAALCGLDPEPPATGEGGPLPLVVEAEEEAGPGAAIGAAVGHMNGPVAALDAVVVGPVDRGLGAGAHLLAAWCSAAAERGAGVVLAPAGADRTEDGGDGFLVRHGFTPTGGVLVRTL